VERGAHVIPGSNGTRSDALGGDWRRAGKAYRVDRMSTALQPLPKQSPYRSCTANEIRLRVPYQRALHNLLLIRGANRTTAPISVDSASVIIAAHHTPLSCGSLFRGPLSE